MKAVSAGTFALIDELCRLAKGPAGGVTSCLRQIASAGEPLAIPRIIYLTFDTRREVAEAAGESVKTLLRLVNVGELGIFDRAFRALSPWAHSESAPWREMRPADLRTVAGLTTAPTLIQLAMCHPNGYVREEAIRRSATCADGFELPFLLLRANDWVKPVRELAQTALRARLAAEHVPELVTALPMIDAMHRWGRLGPTAVVDEIEQLLHSPVAVAALITASRSPDRFLRRAAYRSLFERDLGQNRDLFAAAMDDPDPVICAWASQRLAAADPELFASFADELLRNRLAAIRLAAAQRLLAAGVELPWSELLLDSSAPVRALAQKAALDAGRDPDSEYRARIASCDGARLGVALVGLSETGGPADRELVRGSLRSKRPVVRRSALQALANFKSDDLVDLALGALLDESPTVLRAARDLLLERIASVRGEDAWAAFTTASSGWAKRAALAVLSALGFWESLPYLLRAFDTSDELLRPRVQQYVVRWLEHQVRIFVPPAPSLASEISTCIRESKLPEGVRRELAAVLDARMRVSASGRNA